MATVKYPLSCFYHISYAQLEVVLKFCGMTKSRSLPQHPSVVEDLKEPLLLFLFLSFKASEKTGSCAVLH